MIDTRPNQSQLDDPSEEPAHNSSLEYTEIHVHEDLHPAFSDKGIKYDSGVDCFLADIDHAPHDEDLFTAQQAFTEASQQYEESANPKCKTGIDLRTVHTWEEVLVEVEIARNKYQGVGKHGIKRSIRNGFRSFSKASPAIETWLKLLPSDSVYFSVFCGGMKLILGVRWASLLFFNLQVG